MGTNNCLITSTKAKIYVFWNFSSLHMHPLQGHTPFEKNCDFPKLHFYSDFCPLCQAHTYRIDTISLSMYWLSDSLIVCFETLATISYQKPNFFCECKVWSEKKLDSCFLTGFGIKLSYLKRPKGQSEISIFFLTLIWHWAKF